MWLRRLENKVVEHLLTFILILHLLNHGCKILMASFSSTNRLLSCDKTRTPQKTTRPTIVVCACIRCCGNIFTEPLPSNDRVIHIQTHRLVGDIYEVRR
jgi:hypothetical protein